MVGGVGFAGVRCRFAGFYSMLFIFQGYSIFVLKIFYKRRFVFPRRFVVRVESLGR